MKKEASIYCTCNNEYEVNFYLSTADGDYYLFTNRYWQSIVDFFEKGVELSKAMSMSKTYTKHVNKVMEKIPKYVRYIEMLEGITVLEKTRRKQEKKHLKKGRIDTNNMLYNYSYDAELLAG